ncbi:Disease resistance protein [Quillaja saponaria]|uniref:Disease resistance protein n=1 Tax=Quillaja saponaria TaxID=32244 RepID=A0AAD7LS23_QUISA|nr:Disease resistance protein [Quillaja saponaria]
MALSIVEGAVAGAVFGELLSAVLEVKDKIFPFNPSLKKLKSTIESIAPVIEEIHKYDEYLDSRKEDLEKLIKLMQEGKELVRKCSKIRWWNSWSKSHYRKKLCELDEAIEQFFKLDLADLMDRDALKISVKVKEMQSQIISSGVTERMEALSAPPQPPEFTVGLNGHVEVLKGRLLNSGVSVIVITAPGGMGKTTLAKMLCWDNEIKDKFGDNIFYLTLSKTPNFKLIAQHLLQHKGAKVREFISDDDAINELSNLLTEIGEKPILLVLDDIWSGSESFLEKLVLPLSDYKILVTSRFAFQKFGNPYYLTPLGNEDATTLLYHSAPLLERDSNIHEDLVRKIVKHCAGFPLALLLVGGSLYQNPEAFSESSVKEWSKGHYTVDSNVGFLDHLENLVDVLETEPIIKECFMDLSLFPEDQHIPVAALVDMWAELYKLDEDGVMAMANIYELHTRNLAAEIVVTRSFSGDMNKNYSDRFVIQHDLLHEVAIKQCSQEPVDMRQRLIIDIIENDPPDWWTNGNKLKVTARILSISTGDKFTPNWCNIEPTEVEVLVLNLQTQNYKLPLFMEKMNKVKVLIVTNYNYSNVEFKNFELIGSLCNLRRMILQKVSVPFFRRLNNLKKLSLFMCDVSRAFERDSHMISDSLRNLMEINVDNCTGVMELMVGLCYSVYLKKLCITNCHKLSALHEQIGNLVNLEVLRLSSCTYLVALPYSIRWLHNLSILDLSGCISLAEFPEDFCRLHSLSILDISDCISLRKLPEDFETAALWEQFKPVLENLKVEVPKS